MRDVNTAKDFEEAKKRAEMVIERLLTIKKRSEKHGDNDLYQRISLASKDIRLFLYEHGLIENYQYSELTWESKNRVNMLVEIIIDFFERDQEKNMIGKR
jgi:hypothetical protein